MSRKPVVEVPQDDLWFAVSSSSRYKSVRIKCFITMANTESVLAELHPFANQTFPNAIHPAANARGHAVTVQTSKQYGIRRITKKVKYSRGWYVL